MDESSVPIKPISLAPLASTTINSTSQNAFIKLCRPYFFRIRDNKMPSSSSYMNNIDISPTSVNYDKASSLYSWSMVWFDAAHQHFLFHGHQNPDELIIFPCPNDQFRISSMLSLQKLSIIDVNLPNKSSIILCRLSLDRKLLAIQISLTTILVLDIDTRRQWIVVIKPSTDLDTANKILSDGIIWSEHGGNSQDLIIVTLRGLELYKISSSRIQCKLSRSITQSCYAFWYEPNHRMMLLASRLSHSPQSTSPPRTPNNISPPRSSSMETQQSTTIRTKSSMISLLANGIFFRADKTDHIMPKLELPPPEKSPKFELGPVQTKENISVASIYGNPYCICLQRVMDDDYLILYHITKTSVTRSHILALPCPNNVLKISVLDNILSCHCQHINRSVLFDINLLASSYKSVKLFDGPDSVDVNVILPITPPSDIHISNSNNSSSMNSSEEQQRQQQSSNSTDTLPSLQIDDSMEPMISDTSKSIEKQKTIRTVVSDIYFHSVVGSKGISTNVKYQCFAPAWVWNSDNQSIWRLELDIKAISSVIHDSKKSISFLLRRGQLFDAPRPVYGTINDEEFSELARELIYHKMNEAINSHVGLSWLEAMFKVICVPYSMHIKQSAKNSHSSSSNMSMNMGSDSMMVATSTTSSIRSPTLIENTTEIDSSTGRNMVVEAKKPVSFAASLVSFGYGMFTGNLLTSGNVISSHSTTVTTASTTSTSNATTADISGMNGMVSSDMNISNASKPRRSSNTIYSPVQRYRYVDPEPVDISRAVQIFLAEINNISTSTRSNRVGKNVNSNNDQNTTPVSTSTSTPIPRRRFSSRDMSLSPSTIVTNLESCEIETFPVVRNQYGELVLSQVETFKKVWLPIVQNLQTFLSNNSNNINKSNVGEDNEVKSPSFLSPKYRRNDMNELMSFDYLNWSLSIYISCLRSEGILPHPVLCLLLIHTLSAQRKYMQVAKLLQSQLFPDTIDIAMNSLELADIIEDTELQAQYQSQLNVSLNESDSNTLHTISPYEFVSIKPAVQLLQQVGLDMLWRLGEYSIVVRWLLGHGKIMEAISICLNSENIPKSDLSSLTIPATEFFTSAMGVLEVMNESDHEDMKISDTGDMITDDGRKIELMQTLYEFIREWDGNMLEILPSGKSRLASECQFPKNVFDVFHSSRFKELFGFSHFNIRKEDF